MTRRLAVAVLLFAALSQASPAAAGEGEIDAEVSDPGTSPRSPEPDGPTWTCTWYEVDMRGKSRIERPPYTVFHIDAQRWRANNETGEFWRWARRTCVSDEAPPRTQTDYDWELLTAPDPAIGIDSAYDRVVKKIEPPTPALSPVGPGYVKLGMWLAVDEPAENPVVARAAIVTAWAEVTATLDHTTFDMGVTDNGEPVVITCDGVGDPIPAAKTDSLDQSPDCGYTYTTSDTTGEIEITSTWVVTYELSDGRTGARDDIVLTTTVPYDVREIQTVGVGG